MAELGFDPPSAWLQELCDVPAQNAVFLARWEREKLCSTWRFLGVLGGLSVPVPSSHPFSRRLSCTCFSLQRNPYCTWEGDLAEGCSEPDWDQHWRRSPVLSLPVYCPGIECFGGGREVLEGASHLPTQAWQRFISPLCTADSSFSSEGLPRTPTVSRSALVFLYHFSLFFSFSALITILYSWICSLVLYLTSFPDSLHYEGRIPVCFFTAVSTLYNAWQIADLQ